MIVLGLSGGHDANLCVVRDGEILIHVEKERLTRRRHDSGSMDDQLQGILARIGMEIGDIDLVATSIPVWEDVPITGTLDCPRYQHEYEWTEGRAEILGRSIPAVSMGHHLGHAAYAYYLSPFEAADILTLDAGGNFTCGLLCRGSGHRIEPLDDLPEQTIGILWCALSLRLFGWEFAAGKAMGLAAFGKPCLVDAIWEAYGCRAARGYRTVAMSFPPLKGTFDFPGLPRDAAANWSQAIASDAAASMQQLTNAAVLDLLGAFSVPNRPDALCLGGGLALNCVTNEVVRRSFLFRRVFVGPAPNDAGLSIGFALFAWHHILGNRSRIAQNQSPYQGIPYNRNEVEEAVRAAERRGWFVRSFANRRARVGRIVDLLLNGKTVGIWSGRSESGPRALGHRSILAHPGIVGMKHHVNSRVKFREPFRPFAPSILEKSVTSFFDFDGRSPYMSFAAMVQSHARQSVHDAVQVDGLARLQTVTVELAPELYDVLVAFEAQTGVPAVINTSLNVKGEPLAERPQDALSVLERSALDALLVEQTLIGLRNPFSSSG